MTSFDEQPAPGRVVLSISSTGEGSKAILLCLSPSLVVAAVAGPRLDPHGEPLTAFSARLRAVVADLVEQAPSGSIDQADVGVISLDGVYGKRERLLIAQVVNTGPVPCRRFRFLHRGEACLVAAPGSPWESVGIQIGLSTEVTLLAGHRRPRWPRVLREGAFVPFSAGDGGGYFVGRELLRKVVRGEGLPPETSAEHEFAKFVRSLVGWEDEFDPLRWIWRASYNGGGWRQIADVAQCVAQVAESGDPVAQAILRSAAGLVRASVDRVMARYTPLGKPVRRVVLSGGLPMASPFYCHALHEQIAPYLPRETTWEMLDAYPIVGCVRRGVYDCMVPNADWDHIRSELLTHQVVRARSAPNPWEGAGKP
jgi:hypothetical protein